MRKNRWLAGVTALAVLSSGCDGFLTSFAASSTARVLGRASPGLQRFADIELAEQAIPGSIATMEGLLLIDPENETLHATVARSYASLGFGFLEDHWEQAVVDDDPVRMDHYQARASAAYLRAKAVGFEMMEIWSKSDPKAKLNAGLDEWNRYLATFTEKSQAATLFWTVYAWVRYIGLNRDKPDALADLQFARALAERVKALDPTVNAYAPSALVAGMAGSVPVAVGGKPDVACVEMGNAIKATEGKNLMYYVITARIIAVALQDKPLYKQLLQYVIDAGDVDPSNRLQNQIAKRKAMRYMAQADDLIIDDAGGDEAPPAPSGEEGEAAAPVGKTAAQMRAECHGVMDPLARTISSSGDAAPAQP